MIMFFHSPYGICCDLPLEILTEAFLMRGHNSFFFSIKTYLITTYVLLICHKSSPSEHFAVQKLLSFCQKKMSVYMVIKL